MQVILDHLTALMVGSIALMTMVQLQTRDRTDAVRTTINEAASSQAMSTLDVLSQDLDNAMSERLALEEMGGYHILFERTADDEHTALLEIPAYVRPAQGADPQPAYVRYTLVPDNGTVRVAGRDRPLYAVRRQLDWGGTGTFTEPQMVGRNLVDLDITLRGRASETRSGGAPLRFTSIEIDLSTALPTADQATHDQAHTGSENRVAVGVIVRPPNLTTDRSSN